MARRVPGSCAASPPCSSPSLARQGTHQFSTTLLFSPRFVSCSQPDPSNGLCLRSARGPPRRTATVGLAVSVGTCQPQPESPLLVGAPIQSPPPRGVQEQKMGFVQWGSQVLLSLRHRLARGSAWRQERPPVTHLHPNARHPKPLMPRDGTAEVGLELIWHTARAGGTPSCHLSTSFPHHPEAGSCALAGSGHHGASLNWHQDAAVALQLWGSVPGSGWSPRCCPSPQSQCSKRGPRTFLVGLGGSPGRTS